MAHIPGFKRFFMADGGGAGGGDGGGAGAGAGGDQGGDQSKGGSPGGDQGAGGGQQQFTVPEAYKDKPWAKDFKSPDDVFKSLESAQQFIGRKGFGVPGEKATPEEKAQFYKELGVPDDDKGYEFKKPDGVPDELWDTKHEAKWAGLMKTHNVPKGVANALRDEMLKETIELHNGSVKSLNEAMDKAFGDKKQDVAKQVGAMMTEAIPDKALRDQIEKNIGNKNTPAFATALGLIHQHYTKKYGLADTNTGDGGDGSGGKTMPEMRAEGQKLMATEAYRDPMHKDHAATRKLVDDIYENIGKLTDAGKKK